MAPLVLQYFDVMARGLPVVLVLEMTGVKWKREPVVDWAVTKIDNNAYPFGQLPVLRDGSLVVAQSAAIANFLGRKTRSCGVTENENVISDMLLAEAEVLIGLLNKGVPTLYNKLGTAGKGDYDFYLKTGNELIPQHLGQLEILIAKRGYEGNRFTSSGVTVGELFLFGVLHQIHLVFPGVLAFHPKVKAFYARLHAEPKVISVINGDSAFGPWTQYWVAAEPLSPPASHEQEDTAQNEEAVVNAAAAEEAVVNAATADEGEPEPADAAASAAGGPVEENPKGDADAAP